MRKTASFLALGMLCSGACHAQQNDTRGFALLYGVGPTTIEDEDGPVMSLTAATRAGVSKSSTDSQCISGSA
ncbi:MAG: hypothetical protein AAGM16_00335 [Pseudomonadota bacterium]